MKRTFLIEPVLSTLDTFSENREQYYCQSYHFSDVLIQSSYLFASATVGVAPLVPATGSWYGG